MMCSEFGSIAKNTDHFLTIQKNCSIRLKNGVLYDVKYCEQVLTVSNPAAYISIPCVQHSLKLRLCFSIKYENKEFPSERKHIYYIEAKFFPSLAPATKKMLRKTTTIVRILIESSTSNLVTFLPRKHCGSCFANFVIFCCFKLILRANSEYRCYFSKF